MTETKFPRLRAGAKSTLKQSREAAAEFERRGQMTADMTADAEGFHEWLETMLAAESDEEFSDHLLSRENLVVEIYRDAIRQETGGDEDVSRDYILASTVELGHLLAPYLLETPPGQIAVTDQSGRRDLQMAALGFIISGVTFQAMTSAMDEGLAGMLGSIANQPREQVPVEYLP